MPTRLVRPIILLICAAALLAAAQIATRAFERLPHLEDEIAYLFQAKTYALGRLTVPTPAQADAFWLPFVLDHQGERFGKYPPGWPLLLAVGVKAGAAWLVNPLLASLTLYLVYRLGRTLFDARVGLLAAGLALTSPLLLTLSGSYLSHLASGVLLLSFTLGFIATARGGRPWQALLSGALLGLAFLTRSLTAVGFAAPFALYALAQVIRRRQAHWPRYFWMAGAALATAALLPLYQWRVTGDPWLNPYLLWWPYDKIGFGPGIGWLPGGHSLAYAGLNMRQDLATAASDLLGWPGLSWLPLLLALLPLPSRRLSTAATLRAAWLLTPCAGIVLAYASYWIGSPMRLWGPRYYFEGFGPLWVLAALGLLRGWAWLRSQRPAWRTAAGAMVALLLVANLGINLPARLVQANRFYGISRDQWQPITAAGLTRGLVFVRAERWLEYGALLTAMSPLLDDDLLFARAASPEADAAVIAAYGGRPVYYLEGGVLRPATP